MGQAKLRGTFAERKAQAIEIERKTKEVMAKYDQEHPIKPSGMSTSEKMYLTYLMAPYFPYVRR